MAKTQASRKTAGSALYQSLRAIGLDGSVAFGIIEVLREMAERNTEARIDSLRSDVARIEAQGEVRDAKLDALGESLSSLQVDIARIEAQGEARDAKIDAQGEALRREMKAQGEALRQELIGRFDRQDSATRDLHKIIWTLVVILAAGFFTLVATFWGPYLLRLLPAPALAPAEIHDAPSHNTAPSVAFESEDPPRNDEVDQEER